MSIVELQRKTMLKGLFKEGALHHSQPFNQRSKFGVNYFIESEYGMLSLFGGIADFNNYGSILRMRGDSLDTKSSECPHCDSSETGV